MKRNTRMTVTTSAQNIADESPSGSASPRSIRRLFWSIAPAMFSLMIVWGVSGVFMPLQLQTLDSAAKVQNLTLVNSIGAVIALFAQPIAGALSDRTRSRFGRRAPWMVGGALVGGLALIAMSTASTLLHICLAWAAMQLAFNFVQGPLGAVMPDRIPSRVRGKFSMLIGLGTMLAMLGGPAIAAVFADAIPAGYLLVAGIVVVTITLFVLFNREASTKDLPRKPLAVREFLSAFWVNPIAHPDFFWAFTGRFLLYLGFYVVTGFQLYLIQDYIGLKDEAVGMLPLFNLVSLVGLVTSMLISGPLSDRLNRRRVFVFVASAIVGVAFVVPMLSPTVAGCFAMFFIAGFGFGVFQTVDTALMSEVLPSKSSFGKDLGVVNIAVTLPQTLAPSVAGIIVLVGGYFWLFPVGIVLSILGAFAVWPIKSVR
jgi:MFS family permease